MIVADGRSNGHLVVLVGVLMLPKKNDEDSVKTRVRREHRSLGKRHERYTLFTRHPTHGELRKRRVGCYFRNVEAIMPPLVRRLESG